MLLLGDTYDADTALKMGLVEAVVPASELDAVVERRIASLMANGPSRNPLAEGAPAAVGEPCRSGRRSWSARTYSAKAFQTDEPGIAMRAWSTVSAIKAATPQARRGAEGRQAGQEAGRKKVGR